MILSIISLVVAIAAMLISAYSVYYTKLFNRFKIRIDQATIEKDPDRPYLISFDVFNDSPRAITITGLSLRSSAKKPLPLLPDYKIDKSELRIYEDQEPFVGDILIPANESESFSYFVEQNPEDIIVTVSADQPIHHGSKHQSFVLHLFQFS